MPTHRSLTVALHSQYGEVIPETLSLSSRDILPIGNRVITTSIPTYPSSQFWISYQCPLPPPPKANGDETTFYYFKLFVAGRCVLSWGVGEEEDWQGKVVCGFWDAGTDFEGQKIVERKGLFFPKKEEAREGTGFEIRVFRAMARRREDAKYASCDDLPQGSEGLSFHTTGRKKRGERQRFYTYALIDATDAPFVTFRYILEASGRSIHNSNMKS